MRFVHESHDNVRRSLVLPRQLAPQVPKLLSRGTTLANNLAVPATVVVDVENAFGARLEATLHQSVEHFEMLLIDGTTGGRGQVLPADWQPEDVHFVLARETGHLGCAVASSTRDARDRGTDATNIAIALGNVSRNCHVSEYA